MHLYRFITIVLLPINSTTDCKTWNSLTSGLYDVVLIILILLDILITGRYSQHACLCGSPFNFEFYVLKFNYFNSLS